MQRLVLLAALGAGPALGQVVPDSSLSTIVSGAGSNVTVSGGTRVGGNLFHGFNRFDVPGGGVVTFSALPAVQRIIGRVTSDAASQVDGRLVSPVSLYLFNPRGWVFGSGASLDVQGTFNVSSASYVRLGSDGRFDAAEPSRTVLTASSPSEFGFGAAAASIAVNGSRLDMRPGGEIAVIAGEVSLAGGRLFAPGGRVELSSVQGGAIRASGALISTDSAGSGLPSGAISIRGGRLVLSDRASMQSVNQSASAGGAVSIELSGDATVDNATLSARTSGAGEGGALTLSAASLAVVNGAQIDTATLGGGAGGALSISAGSVVIAGQNASGARSAVLSVALGAGDAGRIAVQASTLEMDGAGISARTFAAGNAGSVDISVGKLSLTGVAQIDATTLGGGRGGDVRVSASQEVFISGYDPLHPDLRSGLFASAERSPFTVGTADGDAGTIRVSTPSLTVAERGFISGGTFGPATGAGGSVVVEAGRILLANGGEIGSRSTGSGLAGSLSIFATSLELRGATISTQADAADGGNISVAARDLVYLHESSITTSVAGGRGSGGNITIDPQFVVLDHSQIIANAFAGNGGNISIVSDNFLSQDSVVQASSQLGVSGNVAIQSPRVDVSGVLRALNSDYLDASRLIRASCATRAHQASSTFIAGVRGGLAQPPVAGQELSERRPVALACGP